VKIFFSHFHITFEFQVKEVKIKIIAAKKRQFASLCSPRTHFHRDYGSVMLMQMTTKFVAELPDFVSLPVRIVN